MEPRLLEFEVDPPNWRDMAFPEVLASLSKKETKRQEVINGESEEMMLHMISIKQLSLKSGSTVDYTFNPFFSVCLLPLPPQSCLQLNMPTCECWVSFRWSSRNPWRERSSWPPLSWPPFSPAWMRSLRFTVSANEWALVLLFSPSSHRVDHYRVQPESHTPNICFWTHKARPGILKSIFNTFTQYLSNGPHFLLKSNVLLFDCYSRYLLWKPEKAALGWQLHRQIHQHNGAQQSELF